MRNYMKPAISFQFMNLATDVSGGCNMTSNSAAYVCEVEIPDNPGLTIFTDTNGNCVMQPADSGLDICFNLPEGGDYRVLGS